jgi:hypothetical protein
MPLDLIHSPYRTAQKAKGKGCNIPSPHRPSSPCPLLPISRPPTRAVDLPEEAPNGWYCGHPPVYKS